MQFARIDSRESFAIETPIFIERQADSHGSLEFRFARIMPLRYRTNEYAKLDCKQMQGHCAGPEQLKKRRALCNHDLAPVRWGEADFPSPTFQREAPFS